MTTTVPAKVTAVQDRLRLTMEDVKKFLRIPADDDTDDDYICLLIDAGKAAADHYMQNPFWELNPEINFDDFVNWPGNLLTEDILNERPDPIKNSPDIQRFQRLDHWLPSLWTDPLVEEEIPADVKLGVVKFVELGLNAPPEGVARERIGDWQRDWTNFVSDQNRLAFIQETYWSHHRLVIGF